VGWIHLAPVAARGRGVLRAALRGQTNGRVDSEHPGLPESPAGRLRGLGQGCYGLFAALWTLSGRSQPSERMAYSESTRSEDEMVGERLPHGELMCNFLHPQQCDALLLGGSVAQVVDAAMAHGALAHGYTPVWYSHDRVAAMSAAVQRRIDNRRGGRP
jgi:hypothetical protein